MFAHLASKATAVYNDLASRGGDVGINTRGIQSWIEGNLIPMGLAFIGLIILFGAKKQQFRDAFGMVTIAVVGISLIVGAAAWKALSEGITGLFLGG